MGSIAWTDASGAPQEIDIDVSQREGHEITAEVTEHAVEKGSDITDHVKPGNGTLTFEGVISNHPLQTPRTQMNGIVGSYTPMRLSSGGNASPLRFSGPFDRVRAVDQLLQDLISSGTLVRITTHLRDYDELLITRFHVDLDVQSGNALPFTLDAKKPRIVETQTAQVPRPRERRGRQTQQRGNRPPTPTPPLRSIAARLIATAVGE